MSDARRRYERIAEELRADIASGTYAVGQRLPSERDLAQRFKVSRPSVREATIALELDGLAEGRRGRSHRFRPFRIVGGAARDRSGDLRTGRATGHPRANLGAHVPDQGD